MIAHRLQLLEANDIDTSAFFTLETETEELSEDAQHIAEEIYANGYVKNTKLHRRWITAHYLRLMKYADRSCDGSWTKAVHDRYTYMYQFKMMQDECITLSVLERKDREAFEERSQFFTLDVMRKMFHQYMDEAVKLIKIQKTRKCRGKKYKRIRGVGNVFLDDIERIVMEPLRQAVAAADRAKTYNDMKTAFAMQKRCGVTIRSDKKKCKIWLNAFQSEGAYYTLMNLVKFHDVKLPVENETKEGEAAVEYLRSLVGTYQGFQWHGLVKDTIDKNHFDLSESIRAHRS